MNSQTNGTMHIPLLNGHSAPDARARMAPVGADPDAAIWPRRTLDTPMASAMGVVSRLRAKVEKGTALDIGGCAVMHSAVAPLFATRSFAHLPSCRETEEGGCPSYLLDGVV